MLAQYLKNGLARAGDAAGFPAELFGELGKVREAMLMRVFVHVRKFQCSNTVAMPNTVPTMMATSFGT